MSAHCSTRQPFERRDETEVMTARHTEHVNLLAHDSVRLGEWGCIAVWKPATPHSLDCRCTECLRKPVLNESNSECVVERRSVARTGPAGFHLTLHRRWVCDDAPHSKWGAGGENE